MLRSLKLRLRPGLVYDGPATYVDGFGNPPLRGGYYALSEDGKSLARPHVRLVAVTAEDGSHHYEVCRKDEPHQRLFPGTIVPGQTVALDFVGEGSAVVAAADYDADEGPQSTCGVCGETTRPVEYRDEIVVYECSQGHRQEFARE